MIDKIKENITIYVITAILGALLAFFGISFLELRTDVKNINLISNENRIIIQETRTDLNEGFEDFSNELNVIRNNAVEIGKLQALYEAFDMRIKYLERDLE